MGRAGLFVTGTDTNVGKTVVSAALFAGAPAELELGYWKPLQTGDDDDAAMVASLASADRRGRVVGPLAHFAQPASPHHAAELEGARVAVDDLVGAWSQLPERPFLVEGAGGWMVPINHNELWPDMVDALDLGVLLVASTRLGCINHTLLSLAALGSRAVGVVMVGPHDPSAWSGIQSHSDVPIVGHLEQAPTIDAAQVATWGQTLWEGACGEALRRRWNR